MKKKENKNRVYLQALSQINKIHQEIALENYPSRKRLAEIINAKNLSVRNVQRILNFLRNELNAPLEYNRQKKGFYYKNIGWNIPLQNLKEKELLAIFIAENALKLTGHLPEAKNLKNALAKLATYLPEKISMDLATLSENVSFQNQPFEASEPEVLQILANSATNFETVEFDYYVQYKQRLEHRRADVYLLHNVAGDWYAISLDKDKNQIRDFHVGRISNLKITNQFFEVNKKIWNKEDYLKKGFQMTRGGKLTEVIIWFDPYQSQWIRSRKNFHPDEKREELPDGSLRLSFEIGENGLEAVARFCLQYAGNCIAEKPKELREIINEKLKKGLDLHR